MRIDEYDILFLSGIFPKEIENEVYKKSKGPIQYAANALQWNIIEGLDSVLEKSLKVLNMMFIGSFPKRYNDIKIKGSKFSYGKCGEGYNIGFVNITILKEWFRFQALKIPLKRWLNARDGRKKVIVIYSVQNLWLSAAKIVKKINNNVHICIIVPDLPIFMSMSKEKYLIYRLYKKYSANKLNKSLNLFDSFVFLTETMNEYFNAGKPYVVIDGIADTVIKDYDTCLKISIEDDKVILYTGTLTRKYGILDLVRAFMTINNSNYKLLICGEGETKQEIINYSKIDSRIIYLGSLQRQDVLALQKKATVLVNPRKNDKFTLYSFPSKTIEYMMSGKPVIMYKLDGMSDEYDEYISYFEGESIKDISNKIIEICEKSDEERKLIGEKARQFVIKTKNKEVQVNKIISLISRELEYD